MLFSAPTLRTVDVAALEEINRIRKQVRHVTGRPRRWGGMLRRLMVARAIRGSNSIEGYKASVEDALAIVEGVEPFDANEETQQALSGFRNAMTFVLQLANDPSFQYEQGFIRSLHYMMLQYDLTKNPGNWRPGAIFVRDEAKKETVYEAPDREMVEPLIRELMASLNESRKEPEIIRAAMAHLNLVMIHPFSDGNGRMARCLQTLVLAREGILEPDFCSIEETLGKWQQEYYDVLALVGGGSWHPKNDTLPWITFMLKAHLTQAHKILWFNEYLDRIWMEAIQITESLGLPERTAGAIADGIMGRKVKNATYRSYSDISENVASRDLKLLVDKKILVAKGDKRGRHYEPAKMLKEAQERTFKPFKIPEESKAQLDLPEQQKLPGF